MKAPQRLSVVALHLGVQMLERSRLDTAGIDIDVQVGSSQTNHSTEPVGTELTFVDKSIQRASRNSEMPGRFFGAEPVVASFVALFRRRRSWWCHRTIILDHPLTHFNSFCLVSVILLTVRVSDSNQRQVAKFSSLRSRSRSPGSQGNECLNQCFKGRP